MNLPLESEEFGSKNASKENDEDVKTKFGMKVNSKGKEVNSTMEEEKRVKFSYQDKWDAFRGKYKPRAMTVIPIPQNTPMGSSKA